MTPKRCVKELAWRMVVRQAERTRRRRVASGASGGSMNGRVSSKIARSSRFAWSNMLIEVAWIEFNYRVRVTMVGDERCEGSGCGRCCLMVLPDDI